MVNANSPAMPASTAQENPRYRGEAAAQSVPEGSTQHDSRQSPRPDWQVASDAREALRFTLGTASSKLTVVVRNGALTIFGSVNFELEKAAAANCVATVPGVLRLSNNVVLSSVFVARR